MGVKIITDVISDINKSVAEKYDIDVMPIEIMIKGKYIPTTDISVEEMVKLIQSTKKIPDFKGVSIEKYEEAFKKYAAQGDDIVCVTAGSIAISNYDCACYAATKFPDAKIHIINTNRFSGNVGLLSVKAAKMAQEGLPANEIADRCIRSLDKLRQTALMDSLDFLKYAGSVPKILAAGTSALNAKFAFAMSKDDERDAEIVGYSMKKAVKNFCTKVFKDLNKIQPDIVFLTHTLSEENYIQEVEECVSNLKFFADVIVCESSHFNTSFVGPNCMTVTYLTK